MKKLLAFAAAISTGAALQAQRLEGTVQNAQNGQALPQANVRLAEQNTGTATDNAGKFSLALPLAPRYILVVSHLGFKPYRDTLRVPVGVERRLQVRLQPRRDELAAATVRAVQTREEAPIAQTNLDPKAIKRVYTGQDAPFVLSQQVPNLITHSEAGTGFSNYGGMRLRGLDQSRLNITFNGVPLNDMLDQGVFFSNFTDIMNSVGRVQVQRGVGFSTNGSASFGGSINFQGPDIWQEKPSAELQFNASSFATGISGPTQNMVNPGLPVPSKAPALGQLNTFRGSAEFKSGVIDDKFAFYGRMSNFTSEGYRYHSGTESWSMFLSGGYRGEKDLLTFTVFNGRSRSQLAYTPVPLPLIEADPRTNQNFEQDRDNFGQQLAQLRYTREISPHLHSTTSLYYGGAGGDFPFGLADSTGQFSGQINYPLTNRHFGVFSNLLYEENELRLRGGIHAYTFKRENWETLLPDNVNRIYSDSTRKNEMSAFVNAAYTLGRFTLQGDVQLRHSTIQFFGDRRFLATGTRLPQYRYTFVNPKIGINYQVSPALQAYASFGRTGREPTKFDLWGGVTRLDSSNLAQVQNPDATVQPEYVNDLEAGIRYRRGPLQAQANFFWMAFEDKIEPIGERIAFVQLRKNVAQSTRAGLEISSSWRPAHGFYLEGMGAFNYARIARYAPENSAQNEVYENVHPALTPTWQGRLTAGYQTRQGLAAELTGQYLDRTFLSPTNEVGFTVPSSLVAHARVSWNFWKQSTLALRVQNLFDALYYTYGEVSSYGGADVPAYYVQPPRNVNLMLTLRF